MDVMTQDIDAAKKVLQQEIKGLEALYEVIDNSFSRTLDILAAIDGKVIVSGMGKSGHIARKIAATLSSTGTSAFFVHPGEASHGDLGMIAKEDAVILLSNSGETAELRDIISYTKRHGIPLIAMVRRKSSILVDAADVALILPNVDEASPIDAPTTSTTMMLALGDAIAMALVERHAFTHEDFNQFHPGGSLGTAFTKIEDIMHKGEALPTVTEDLIMSEVILEITQKHVGCVAVLDNEGHLKGVITDGDLRRHMSPELLSKTAGEVMSSSPKTIESHHIVAVAVKEMENFSINNLCVTQKGTLVGIIHIQDCLRAGF